MNPFNLVQQFSKQTGIKDTYIDTMLQQQAQQKILWIPAPPPREPWPNPSLFDDISTTSTHTHQDPLTIDVPQQAFDALNADIINNFHEWASPMFWFSQQERDEFVDAEWRPVPKALNAAIPPRKIRDSSP